WSGDARATIHPGIANRNRKRLPNLFRARRAARRAAETRICSSGHAHRLAHAGTRKSASSCWASQRRAPLFQFHPPALAAAVATAVGADTPEDRTRGGLSRAVHGAPVHVLSVGDAIADRLPVERIERRGGENLLRHESVQVRRELPSMLLPIEEQGDFQP